MFKLIFEFLTDPLGLPIPWIWEYLILAVIGTFAYVLAFRAVGDMYDGGMIDGGYLGSFFHWLIRLVFFVVIWAVVYGVIALVQWISANWVIILGCLGAIVIIATIIIIVIRYTNNQDGC